MPKTVSKAAGHWLLDRRPDRQAGRQQQAVLLLRAGVQRRDCRRRRSSASACRPRSNGRATSRSPLDNLGNPYPYIKDPLLTGACTAADQTACFSDGGVVGRIPQDRLYSLGLNILKMYPMPNNQSTTLGTNHQFIQPTYDTLLYQPALRLDYQMTPGLRVSFKYRGQQQREARLARLAARLERHDRADPEEGHGSRHGQLQPQLDDVPRGHLRARGQPAGGLRRVVDQRRLGFRASPASPNLPLIFPDANVINPDYYAYEILNFQNPPYWDGTRIYKVPAFQWGNRRHRGYAERRRRT